MAGMDRGALVGLVVMGAARDTIPLRPGSPARQPAAGADEFRGREREVAELEELLRDPRLLTLYGPGGAGKTRLALAVAQEVVEKFEDGVWWVDLASISDPRLVPLAVATALGVREVPDRSLTESLAEYLGPRRSLVILDNCEHLVYGCAALADTLLRSMPLPEYPGDEPGTFARGRRGHLDGAEPLSAGSSEVADQRRGTG